ncbi:MAG: hypothetical protein IPM02_05190 [Betaproteobacteria bacterium]|nr:hypothetical protein [Betaproteobacteria bacterium]
MSAELRGLDGEYLEADLPLLVQRRGMAYWHDDHVRILDRRRLPHEQVELVCRTVEDVAVAIEEMAIQGAFTLSLAAGYGMALAIGDPATAVRDGRLAAQRAGRDTANRAGAEADDRRHRAHHCRCACARP